MEQARQTGQAISSAAEDGTFAAGVHRVTELMPSFMNDILGSAPDDQKVRNATQRNATYMEKTHSVASRPGHACRCRPLAFEPVTTR